MSVLTKAQMEAVYQRNCDDLPNMSDASEA